MDRNKLFALEAIELIALGIVKTLTLGLIANPVESCLPFPTAGIRIANDDKQCAIVPENTTSLAKDLNETLNIEPRIILQPELAAHMIVPKSEIGRRCDDELDKFVRQFAQLGQGIPAD